MTFEKMRNMRKSYKNRRFRSKTAVIAWSEWGDSNARPREPKSRALPTALHPDIIFFSINLNVKGNYQLWSNLWSKIIFRHSSVNIIIQKPSNIKGFEASKTKSTNFLHSAPKAGALPTALHPENIDCNLCEYSEYFTWILGKCQQSKPRRR